MKSGVTILLLLLAFSPGVGFCGANPCEGVDESTISQHISLPKMTIVSKRVISNTCEVIARVMNEHVPLYVFGDYIIAGDLFMDKKHVTQQSMGETQVRSFANLKPEIDRIVAFSYKPASGAHKYIYMFTDPECQFCELAKYQMRDFAEKKKIEIRVVFYPLPMHDGAREKVIKGICSKMDYGRYLEGDYTGNSCKEGEEMLNRALSVGESLELNGTPTFISQDGKRVVGFDPKQLEALL